MPVTVSSKDALGPIEFVVRLALGLTTGFLLLAAVSSIVSAGDGRDVHTTLGEWGDPHPCLQVPQGGLLIGTTGSPGTIGSSSIHGLKPGVHIGVPHIFTVCADHLSGADRTLFSVPVVLESLWTLGFLWLTLRLIRRARRRGLFTHEVASATTILGWYILGGWAIVNIVGGVLRAIAVSHLIAGYGVIAGALQYMSWSWAIVFAGFGVISIGRVMQRTVPMREELEATV